MTSTPWNKRVASHMFNLKRMQKGDEETFWSLWEQLKPAPWNDSREGQRDCGNRIGCQTFEVAGTAEDVFFYRVDEGQIWVSPAAKKNDWRSFEDTEKALDHMAELMARFIEANRK